MAPHLVRAQSAYKDIGIHSSSWKVDTWTHYKHARHSQHSLHSQPVRREVTPIKTCRGNWRTATIPSISKLLRVFDARDQKHSVMVLCPEELDIQSGCPDEIAELCAKPKPTAWPQTFAP